MFNDNDTAIRELDRLLADRLPAGYRLNQFTPASIGEERADNRQFYVSDGVGRRRSFSYGASTLEGLLSEVRRLALEVRRIENWKLRKAMTEQDMDALAADLCPYLAKSKGTRWGRAGEGFHTPCCSHDAPAGTWWIHEDSGMPAAGPRGAVWSNGKDIFFDNALDFAHYLIRLKEYRFARPKTVRQVYPRLAQPFRHTAHAA